MIIALIPARTLNRLDTLAGDTESIASLLITDAGVSVRLAGEIINRAYFERDELVPVRAGLYEAVKLRGNYPGPVPVKGSQIDVKG